MQAGNDLMQAILGLMTLFATVFCIIPSALTLVEVQRLRKKLNEACSQLLFTTKPRPRLFCPTDDFGAGFKRLGSWRLSLRLF